MAAVLVGLLSLSVAYGALAYSGRAPWPAGLPDLVSRNSLVPVDSADMLTVQPTPRFVGGFEGVASDLRFPSSDGVPDPTPPPPPVAEKATLTLAKGWHAGITASINGGKPVKLSQNASYKMEPGDYTVRFSLVTPDYRASRTLQAKLAA